MKNIKKTIGILMIIAGICAIGFGFASTKVADSYKGVTVITGGYISDGKMILNQDTSTSGVAGDNPEAVKRFNMISICSYILGVLFLIYGVVQLICYMKKKKE